MQLVQRDKTEANRQPPRNGNEEGRIEEKLTRPEKFQSEEMNAKLPFNRQKTFSVFIDITYGAPGGV